MQGRRITPVQMRPAGPRHPAGVRGRSGRGVRGEQCPGRGVVVHAEHQGQRPQHGERGGGHRDARLPEAVHEPGGEGRDDRRRGQTGRGDGPGQGVRTPGPGDHDDRADAEHPHRQPGDQVARRERPGPGRGQQPEVRVRRRPPSGAAAPGRGARGRDQLASGNREQGNGMRRGGPVRAGGRDGPGSGLRAGGGGGYRHTTRLARPRRPGPTPTPHRFTRLCCEWRPAL